MLEQNICWHKVNLLHVKVRAGGKGSVKISYYDKQLPAAPFFLN